MEFPSKFDLDVYIRQFDPDYVLMNAFERKLVYDVIIL